MAALRVLGPVEVVDRGGVAIPLAPRTRRLLAALSTRANQTASADWLIESVWEDEPPRAPEAALQTLVSRLRTALDRAEGLAVLTRPAGYLLHAGPDTFDVLEWQSVLQQAARSTSAAQRAALLAEGLACWRGAAYAEYADAQFVQPEVARLTELRVSATEDWAELQLSVGEIGSALGALNELVRDHPFRERPARLLMLAQYRLGRTAEALATFQDLRSRWADELGLDPSPDLITLQTQILNNDPRLGPQQTGPPRARARTGGGLPQVELIGRETDQRELVESVQRTRLVTVVGPGGVGKTSLVGALLTELSAAYAEGSAVVELSRVPPGSSVAAALCTVLQVPGAQDADPESGLISFLGERAFLLIVDNCEHLVADVAALVGRVLVSCPRVSVLATSRIPLRIAGEEVFALRPLEVHGSSEAAEPTPLGPAVQLFLNRAQQRVRGFEVGDDGLADVIELCSRLDGLPLAIELAASQMASLAPADLLARLHWRLTVLHGGPAVDPRHRTLGALVDWSYRALTTAEQQLFEIISIFAGEFTLDAVEGLVGRLDPGWNLGEVLTTLGSLVDQSLLTRRPPGSTFVLLETIRTYGRQRLAVGRFAGSAARAHAERYAALAADGHADLYGADHLARVQRLARTMDELRAAYHWAAEKDVAVAAELVGGLAPLVEHRLLGEIAEWADDLLDRLGDRVVPRVAQVCAVAAAGARFSGQLERARTRAGRAVELAGADAAAAAYGYLLLGEVDFLAGDLDQAVAWRPRVAALAVEHPHLQPLLGMVDCLGLLAAAYSGDTEVAPAAWDLQQRAERRGWPVVAAWALYVRGEVLADHDPVRADALLTEALERARDLDERYLSGVALVAAASARARHGDPRSAVSPFIEVVQHWRDRGDWTHQWTTLRNVLELLIRLGSRPPAVVLAAALLDPGRPATGYGADAARLTATAQALGEALDPGQHADLVARGRSFADHQVVSFALATLADLTAAAAAPSVVQSIEPEEAEVLDGQHRHGIEAGPRGVVGQDRPTKHGAGPRRGGG